MYNKIIFLILFLFPISLLGQTNQMSKDKVPSAPVLDWPYARPNGFRNYAQELIFNRNKGEYYLEKAKAYYMAGYNGMRTTLNESEFEHYKRICGLSFYEPRPEKYNEYDRDPYRVEILTPTGDSALNDFVEAEWYFTKALGILGEYVQWDSEVATQPIYKNILYNTYKSLVYCAVYVGNYKKAIRYLDEFKKYSSDDMFIIEWEARIYGILVEIAKKYDWVFVGPLSYDALRKKHREILIKAIDRNFPGESKTKEELKKRIYPDLTYEESFTNNQGTTNRR